MNVEINFTYLNMGWSLCLVCNLGAIRGRFRRVFCSVLFAVLFLLLKLDFSLVTLTSFKPVLFNYYTTSLVTSFDCEDPRTFKTVCLKCKCPSAISTDLLLHVASLFFCIIVILNISYSFTLPGPAVIGLSCCGVPAYPFSLV